MFKQLQNPGGCLARTVQDLVSNKPHRTLYPAGGCCLQRGLMQIFSFMVWQVFPFSFLPRRGYPCAPRCSRWSQQLLWCVQWSDVSRASGCCFAWLNPSPCMLTSERDFFTKDGTGDCSHQRRELKGRSLLLAARATIKRLRVSSYVCALNKRHLL